MTTRRFFRFCFFAFVLFSTVFAFSAFPETGSARTIVAPRPETESVDDSFRVFVDGTEAPVYRCRVSAIPFNRVWPGSQRPLDQTELAGFAYWETDGPVEIVVETTRKIASPNDVVLRPKSLGLAPTVDVDKGTISFRMEAPSPLTVEIGGFHNALHLLPTKIFERPADPNAPNLRYFGPGVSEIGRTKLSSGDRVFIDAGAVVYGTFFGNDVSDVEISGPGILDASKLERGQGGGLFHFSNSKNVRIDGVVQRDSDAWGSSFFNCDDVRVENTRQIGFWRYNADGIDVCNCENVRVENCFVRSFDDSLVVKGLGGPTQKKSVRNVVFRNCVVWCDWGRACEIGAETSAPEIENVRFERCDVIRTTHIALDVQHGDRAAIRDVVFSDINVEIDDAVPLPVYQNSDEMKYVDAPSANYCPTLAVLVVRKTAYSKDAENGTIANVLYKNVRALGDRAPSSSFTGLDAAHNVRGVVFENLRIGDSGPILSPEAARLQIGEFVDGLEWRE